MQLASLIDPLLAMDAIFEGKESGELDDVFVTPEGDLFEGVNTELIQPTFNTGGDAFELAEVIDDLRACPKNETEVGIAHESDDV